jgi:hypothetical protein
MPIVDSRTRRLVEPSWTPTAGNTWRWVIQTKKNIRAIHLNCTTAAGSASVANMGTDILRARLTYAGQVILDDLSPAEVLMVQHFYRDIWGVFVPLGDLPLYGCPFEYALDQMATYMRLGMLADAADPNGGINELVLEIQMLSPGGGLTITGIQPFIEVDDDPPEGIGDHLRFLHHQTGFAATGVQHITDINKTRSGSALRALYFPVTVGTLTAFTIQEGDDFREVATPLTVIHEMQLRGGRVPQTATHEAYAWNLSNSPDGIIRLDTLTRLDIAPTWSVAPGAVYNILGEFVYRGLTA